MAGEDAAKAADKPAEEPAKELERLEEDDEFEEFETEGASCHSGAGSRLAAAAHAVGSDASTRNIRSGAR